MMPMTLPTRNRPNGVSKTWNQGYMIGSATKTKVVDILKARGQASGCDKFLSQGASQSNRVPQEAHGFI